jgi:ATP-dependent exoDNAse (exonuclease V) beta subunit
MGIRLARNVLRGRYAASRSSGWHRPKVTRRNPVPNNNLPADARQREQALDISRSFIVQAPAGSGKTELLTQRYLRLLAEVDEPEEVLAITFTKKAAGEMRDRVLKALRSAQQNAGAIPIDEAEHKRVTRELAAAVLQRSQKLGWRLLDSPSRLRIQTIDSFCYALVQQTPVQARFGAAGEIAEDGADRSALFLEAAYNTIKLLGSIQDPTNSIRRVLVHRDNNVGQVAQLIAAMLARRDQWERHVSGHGDSETLRAELEAVLARIVCEALERVRAKIPREQTAELVRWMRYAADNLNGNGGSNPYAPCLDLDCLPGCTVEDLEKWRTICKLLVKQDGEWRQRVDARNGFPPERKLEKKQFSDLLGDFASMPDGDLLEALQALESLPAFRFENSQWQVLEALLTLLPIAVAELRKIFQQRGVVDFIEVSQGSLRVLAHASAAADSMAARLRHLLVDEFQDTSVSQWRLLERLTAGWESGDGRTLFLVGDPMQSIYRFRQAEVGLFLQAKQTGIGGIKLNQLALNVNFRSDEALVAWFNEQFEPIFGETDNAAEGVVSFNPAAARPKAPRGTEPVVHFAADSQEEAAWVTTLAGDALHNDEGDVAIIVRARTHLPLVVAALRDAGLPFQAVEIDNLSERQPVLDVLMLTRALLHAADRLAWLAVLRAPWCGLTLDDLDALGGHDHNSAIWDLILASQSPSAPHPRSASHLPSATQQTACHPERSEGSMHSGAAITPDGLARLLRMRDVFSRAFANRRRLPLRHWIEGVWIALGGPACLESPIDLQDIETFFDLVEGIEESGDITDPAYLAERVSALFAKPAGGDDCPLKILTIHKAKGLEFDTVILPGLGRISQKDDSPLLLWEERPGSNGTELLLAPISEKGASENDPIYCFLRSAESARKSEEDKRLLYVAVTRARHHLHILAVPRLKKSGELRQDGSLLQYLWPGVSDGFVPPPAIDIAAQADDEEQEHAHRVPMQLRRLPSGWALPVGPEPVTWRSDELETVVPANAVTYNWVGEKLRHIGIVVHAMLQRITREGAAAWDPRRLAAQRPLLQTALAARGLCGADLDEAVAQVERALLQILADEKGRWTLAAHAEAESEYAITGVLEGRIHRCKFDRTFVDEQGTRWIIDYKTSTHQGAGVESFLDQEQDRYREQLETYARIMRMQHPGQPIRLGLYFPLLRAWREVNCKF